LPLEQKQYKSSWLKCTYGIHNLTSCINYGTESNVFRHRLRSDSGC
jgi:hypothetical protein